MRQNCSINASRFSFLESVVFPNGIIRINWSTLRYVGQASLRREILQVFFLKISWLFLDNIFLRCTTVYSLEESVQDKNLKIESSAPRAQLGLWRTERIQYFHCRRDYYFCTIFIAQYDIFFGNRGKRHGIRIKTKRLQFGTLKLENKQSEK